jgi:hypothetical protein
MLTSLSVWDLEIFKPLVFVAQSVQWKKNQFAAAPSVSPLTSLTPINPFWC